MFAAAVPRVERLSYGVKPAQCRITSTNQSACDEHGHAGIVWYPMCVVRYRAPHYGMLSEIGHVKNNNNVIAP